MRHLKQVDKKDFGKKKNPQERKPPEKKSWSQRRAYMTGKNWEEELNRLKIKKSQRSKKRAGRHRLPKKKNPKDP